MRPISIPVSVHTTSSPPTDADVRQHRSIRLDALRTDPQSFLATYAQESKVDHAEWRERLEQEGVRIFFAKIVEANGFGDAHMPPKPWLATLSLLSPSFLTSFLASSCTTPITTHTVSSPKPSWPLSLLDAGTDLWLIVGLWVRPEWRRKGVAQKIVQEAVLSTTDAATLAPDTHQSPSGSSNSKTTIILLEVYARNTAAVELYRSVGFEILSNPDRPSCPPYQGMDTMRNGGSRVRRRCEMEETHWMGYTIPPLLRSNL